MVLTLSRYFMEQIADICYQYVEESNTAGIPASRDGMVEYLLEQDKRGVTKKGKKRTKRKDGPKQYTGYTLFSMIHCNNIKKKLIDDEEYRKYTTADGDERVIDFDDTPPLTKVATKTGSLWRNVEESKKEVYANLSKTVNDELSEIYGTEDNFSDDTMKDIRKMLKSQLNLDKTTINGFIDTISKTNK